MISNERGSGSAALWKSGRETGKNDIYTRTGPVLRFSIAACIEPGSFTTAYRESHVGLARHVLSTIHHHVMLQAPGFTLMILSPVRRTNYSEKQADQVTRGFLSW